jgi:hypothetical protein
VVAGDKVREQMQKKLVELFWANRLWINGVMVMLFCSYAVICGDMSKPAAKISMWTGFYVGACMVVFSPLHAKTAASKFVAFAVSAIVVSILLGKVFH